MTTARERARLAADKAHVRATCNGEGGDPIEKAANAASDVWEPILRELVDCIFTHEVATGYLRPSNATWSALTRAKEALKE